MHDIVLCGRVWVKRYHIIDIFKARLAGWVGGAVKWLAGWSIRQLYSGGHQRTDVVIVDLGWLLLECF